MGMRPAAPGPRRGSGGAERTVPATHLGTATPAPAATAAELASTMAQQRCRIEFFRPNVTSLREEDVSFLREMKSIADIGGSPLARPLFLVTPGLRKWGNGWGQNLEESTVMYPAQLATEAEDY